MTQLDKALVLAFLAGASVSAINKFTGVAVGIIEDKIRQYFASGIALK